MPESFAGRLALALEKAGGLSAVLPHTDVSQATLYRYLNGASARIDSVLSLARACNVNRAWLAFGEGPMRSGRGEEGLEENLPADALSGKNHDKNPDKELSVQTPNDTRRASLSSNLSGNLSSSVSGNVSDDVSLPCLQPRVLAQKGLTFAEALAEKSEAGASEKLSVPPEMLRQMAGRVPVNGFFMEMPGDGMKPTLEDGDLLLVDLLSTAVKIKEKDTKEKEGGNVKELPVGIYAVTIGGVVQVKRLDIAPASASTSASAATTDPASMICRVSSDNRFYAPFELPLEEVSVGEDSSGKIRLLGRLLGRFQRGI